AYGLALVGAFLSKQNALAFPLILVLVELVLFGTRGRELARRIALPVALLVILPALGQLTLRATASNLDEINAVVLDEGIGRREYVLTQIPVLVTYLRLALLPVGQNLDHDVSAVRSLFEPAVVASGTLLVALLALGVWLLAGRGRRDPGWRLVGLGIVWFFVLHAVESSGVGRIDFLFEHRMYLPSAGLFLAAVVAIALGAPPRLVPVSLAAVAAAALVLGAATWARNQVWRSELRLYRDVVAKSPEKARALTTLGRILLDKRRADEAEALFLRALEVEPRRVETLVSLGVVARVKRDPARAESYLGAAVALDPEHWVALVNLGDLALERGDLAEAERDYRRAAEHEELSTFARRRLERLARGQRPGEIVGVARAASAGDP
ncbi:MAG: tetratricopeptide repeat protein, partial [Myxococcota bacterium]